MLGMTCESRGASTKLGITKDLVFPRERRFPLCPPGLQELLGFTHGLQSRSSAQSFSRCWSCVLGLLGGFGSSWTCVGASQGPVTILESCVCWDLFLAPLLIHVGLWNCSRALDGYGTGVVMEKAGKRKRTPVKARGKTGTSPWLCVWMLGVQKYVRQQEPGLMSWKPVQISTTVEC